LDSRELENIESISPLIFVKVLTVTTGCWRPRSMWKGRITGIDMLAWILSSPRSASCLPAVTIAPARDGEQTRSGVGHGAGASPTTTGPQGRRPPLPLKRAKKPRASRGGRR
jgi:hypothetical protein